MKKYVGLCLQELNFNIFCNIPFNGQKYNGRCMVACEVNEDDPLSTCIYTLSVIYPFTDRLTLGLQQLVHQIQGIAILAIEFHPRTKYIFLRTLLYFASHS